MRLNPHHPERFWNHLGRAYFVAREYKEAIDAFRRISKPDQFHHAFLAAAHAMDGDPGSGRAASQSGSRRSIPAFTVEDYMSTLHYKRASDTEHHREALLQGRLAALGRGVQPMAASAISFSDTRNSAIDHQPVEQILRDDPHQPDAGKGGGNGARQKPAPRRLRLSSDNWPSAQ